MYLDPDKMHVLNHKGDDLSVRGPLNIARPVQGWPVIVQAGQSEPGRQLAAETAEAVFCSPKDMSAAKELYADIKERATAAGRDRSHLKILPAAMIIIGDSVDDAIKSCSGFAKASPRAHRGLGPRDDGSAMPRIAPECPPHYPPPPRNNAARASSRLAAVSLRLAMGTRARAAQGLGMGNFGTSSLARIDTRRIMSLRTHPMHWKTYRYTRTNMHPQRIERSRVHTNRSLWL